MQRIAALEKRAFFSCLSALAFLGAYLLFQIEPLSGKIITPLLGGTSEVWVVCLLFFQLVVLCGYSLTYLLAKLPPKAQLVTYVLLFGFSLFWAAVPPAAGWHVDWHANPTWQLLNVLTKHLSVPC